MGAGAGFNALAQANIEERLKARDEERQAQLGNILNAGLSPQAQQGAIRTLYAGNPSLLKNHLENFFRRAVGKQPQPAPLAYPAQSVTTQPTSAIPGAPAPAPVTVNYPGARTQADRRQQILSGGSTPEQRQEAGRMEQLAYQRETAEDLARDREKPPTPEQQAIDAHMKAHPGENFDDAYGAIYSQTHPPKAAAAPKAPPAAKPPTRFQLDKQQYDDDVKKGFKGSFEQWLVGKRIRPGSGAHTPAAKLTATQNKAQGEYIEAYKLANLADQVAAHPDDALNQKRLAVALEKMSAGRFTTQALSYIIRLGWGNTIQQWANNPSTGALPADVLRQLVDGAKENLTASEAAMDEANRLAAPQGPAPRSGNSGAKHLAYNPATGTAQ